MTSTGLRVFDGAVAIVTGAASGIGRALSEELARRGASVVLADVQPEVADVAAGIPCASGRAASGCTIDVTDFDGLRHLIEGVAGRYGRLDCIFNNAGIAAGGELRDHTLAAWNRVIDVNLRGVIHGVQAAYPIMLRQGFGHIVNTASMQGLMPSPLTASYSTTKHAIVGLSKALRVEAAGAGVRVSVLCPGVIRTPLLSGGKHGIFIAAIPEPEQRDRALRYFERLRPMDVRQFAVKALDQVARNHAIIVVPAWWKVFWWLDRLSPRLSLFVAQRVFESARRDLFGPSQPKRQCVAVRSGVAADAALADELRAGAHGRRLKAGAFSEETVHVLSEAVHVLVHGLRATTMKLDHERAHARRCDQVREPETVYVYEYVYGDGAGRRLGG